MGSNYVKSTVKINGLDHHPKVPVKVTSGTFLKSVSSHSEGKSGHSNHHPKVPVKSTSSTFLKGLSSHSEGKSRSSSKRKGTPSRLSTSHSYQLWRSRSRSRSKSQSRSRSRSSSRSLLSHGGDHSHNNRYHHSRSPSPTPTVQSRKTDNFPMSTERFQKRVLFLLASIRDAVNMPAPATSTSTADEMRLEQMDSLEDFERFDEELAMPGNISRLEVSLSRIGGVDAKEHTKKAMGRTLTNGLMAKMNLSGTGNFKFGATQLHRSIIDVVIRSHVGTTEQIVTQTISKYLKYAPERPGGGGRREKITLPVDSDIN